MTITLDPEIARDLIETKLRVLTERIDQILGTTNSNGYIDIDATPWDASWDNYFDNGQVYVTYVSAEVYNTNYKITSGYDCKAINFQGLIQATEARWTDGMLVTQNVAQIEHADSPGTGIAGIPVRDWVDWIDNDELDTGEPYFDTVTDAGGNVDTSALPWDSNWDTHFPIPGLYYDTMDFAVQNSLGKNYQFHFIYS